MTVSLRERANKNATHTRLYTGMTALTNPVPARLATLAILGAMLAACAYDPPVVADHRASAYQTDLTACRGIADRNAHHQVMSSGPLFLTYPLSLPLKERIETRRCMVGKGYKLASD
jgi:hypothetical protein